MEKIVLFFNKMEVLKNNLAKNSSSSMPPNPLSSSMVFSPPTVNIPVASLPPTKLLIQ